MFKLYFGCNLRTKGASDIVRMPSFSSRQGTLERMNFFEKSRSKFDFRSRSHDDPTKSCCISVEASWQDKHDATIISLALFNRELLAKDCW